MANTSVYGIYSNVTNLDNAIAQMKIEGFRNTDISVLFAMNEGTKDFAVEKATKAPEGGLVGGASGVVLGGALAWLAAAGALAIPGLGPLVAAGPLLAALTGAGAGAVVGGITGSLVGMGIPEFEAKRYEGRIRKGHMLLSVHCDSSDWSKKAKEILEATGAEDIASSGEASGDYANADKPSRRVA